MKYAIHFDGYWPVGAVAVVEARNEKEAASLLFQHPDFQPHVLRNNLVELEDSAVALVKEVEILLNGNY